MSRVNFSKEYGYWVHKLKQYPFNEQIKNRLEEIECPWRPSDANHIIKGKNPVHTPKALLDLMKKESDKTLHKYELMREAVDMVKAGISQAEWSLIRDVYINKSMTVEGAAYKYLDRSKNYAYDNIIWPFFRRFEETVFELSVAGKFSMKVSMV
ncbi:MAG: hypothetical protein FWF42_00105 [Streptococcaceae bacterium]|nr:hypothetical protein [Streptococcaceae bacterium]MCL2680880.1 hypothetical protein [Streptococcaceae bacterium]MCL2858076.1 hypothetical protein [Streptococcaceae bacterium]